MSALTPFAANVAIRFRAQIRGFQAIEFIFAQNTAKRPDHEKWPDQKTKKER